MSYQSTFWENYFRYYDVLLELIPYQELMNTLVAGLAPVDEDELLDLGCGTGNIRYFTSKGKWTGIDNSEAALHRYKSKFPNTKLFQASITEKLPFEDNSFSKVVSNNVLYTLPRNQWPMVIKEVHRVLKPGGKFVIANLNDTFKPMTIYKDHIGKSRSTKGLWITMKQLVQLAAPTVQMFRYNAKIKKENQAQVYAFMQGNEQLNILQQHGFQALQTTTSVYSGCGVLDVVKNS